MAMLRSRRSRPHKPDKLPRPRHHGAQRHVRRDGWRRRAAPGRRPNCCTGDLAVVSSFGADSSVLLHMVAQVDQTLPVYFLETGKHFPRRSNTSRR